MVSVRLAALAVAAVALFAPLAAAAAAQGHLEAARLTLPGPASLAAEGIDYVWNAEGLPELTLRVDGLHVERIGTQTILAQGPAGPSAVVTSRALDAKADHGAATLSLILEEGVQVVALRALGASTLNLTDAAVRPVGSVLHATTGLVVNPDQCRPPRCLDATGVYEISSAESRGEASGEIILLLRGPTLRVDDGAGGADYASGVTETQNGALVTREDAWIVVTATGAQATLAGPSGTWYAGTPLLSTTAARFDGATGAIEVGAMQYRARDDMVRAAGELTIEMEPAEAAATYADDQSVLYGGAFAATLSGEISELNLRSAPVFVDSPGETAGLLAAILGGIAGIAYYWPRLAFAAASLYTRLKQPDILDNDVRNNIYDIIRRNPGISARAVHRESEQSWGTVVYHLRQLERHHLVMSRTLGRTRNYYESQGNYRGMEIQLACLQSDRALALARAILAQPGITQEQLAQTTGLPQPTTSYYVRKLKQASLIDEQREGRYAKYLPHADLARYLELTESAAPPTAPAAGANA